MRHAIHGLDQLADCDLFPVLAEGIPLIVDNAVELAASAGCLYQACHWRPSEILRGAAEEEAGKVLVLIDYVRCPRSSEQRGKFLRRFYDHVAKRIHAMACSYPGITSFGEMSEFVNREYQPWYLDGPNDIDWIFPNEITAQREHFLYVDFVREMSASAVSYWAAPNTPVGLASWNRTPDCVRLVQFLSKAGAGSADGMAAIADIWRGFEPCPDTDRGRLHRLNVDTMSRFAEIGGPIDEETMRFVMLHWPFPLWPLAMGTWGQGADDLESLKEKRDRVIKWIEETGAKRDPPPAISRSKVEAMSAAWATWRSDSGALYADRSGGGEGFRFRLASDLGAEEQLPSYSRLVCMLGALSGEERVALAALAEFVRQRVADWPRAYRWAIDHTPMLGDDYQVGLGWWWRSGLDRWESKPGSFSPGQIFRANRA